MLMPQDVRPWLRRTADGADVQRHVIGALIMRELQTRYGRANIGYMWMLAEPALLAASVALIHVGSGGSGGGHYTSDLRLIPFTLIGYCTFMIFRSIVTRAETTLDSNKTLLFHRAVSILDMLLARAILELLATMAALALLLSLAVVFGIADWPARPLRLLAGILLLTWFSLALSMGIATGSYFSKAFNKFVHPLTYIAMPLSGAFFVLQWIPQPYRGYLSWSPLDQATATVPARQVMQTLSPSRRALIRPPVTVPRPAPATTAARADDPFATIASPSSRSIAGIPRPVRKPMLVRVLRSASAPPRSRRRRRSPGPVRTSAVRAEGIGRISAVRAPNRTPPATEAASAPPRRPRRVSRGPGTA